MQAIEVLQEIRAERVCEFNSYLEITAKVDAPPQLSEYTEEQQKLKKTLLTLELPWKTDVTSVSSARLVSNQQFIANSENLMEKAFFEEWLNQSTSFSEKYKRQTLEKLPSHLGLEIRVDWLEHYMFSENIIIEDLDKIVPLQALKKAMVERGYNESTIIVYLSKLKTFLEFKRYPSNKSTNPIGVANFPLLESMAIFFDRLECKCIETKAKNDIAKLIAARTLFYGGQRSIRALRFLKADQVNGEMGIIEVGADADPIPVPGTFSRLVAVSLSPGDQLISFTEQRLHEWITKLTGEYGVSDFSPSTLKRGFIAVGEELGVDLTLLPKR